MALTSLRQIWDSFTTSPFNLQDIDDFPYEVYQEQLAEYRDAEKWYSGEALNETSTSQTGKEVELYPLKINPLRSTVQKHAYTLFGELEDNGKTPVYPRILYENDNEKEAANEAEDKLNYLWWENNGRALMMENAITSQVYGGCVFKATFAPWEAWRSMKIRIERFSPKGFIGIPDAANPWFLTEAWFIRPITLREARRWGYPAMDDEMPWYIEHWKTNEWSAKINDMPITIMMNGQKYAIGGENPFGFIPAVYIPHIRGVSDFYGENALDHLKGIVREMNLRFADYGDAINDDAHGWIAMRNVTGSPQIKKLSNDFSYIDLGSVRGISGNEPDPDAFEVRKQRASAAMKELLTELKGVYGREAYVPAVAYGEDEGSQRSALTLATRFWPLTAHTSTERYYWTVGMNVFNSFLLKMMKTHKIGGITESHTTMRIKQIWAPQLPRDREALVQEWQLRAASDLGSVDHLLELTGDVEDVEEEKKRMLDWKRSVGKIEQEFAPKPAFGAGSSPNPPTQAKPKQPAGGGGG